MTASKRCAFLTLEDPTGYDIDDELAADPLRAFGVEVTSLPWDAASVDWAAFDLVVIRSPWDCMERVGEFMERLAEIDAASRLLNPLGLVRWNLDKRYLRALEQRGVPGVPTRWFDAWPAAGVAAEFDRFGCTEMVAKPVVGAGAIGAFRLTPETDPRGAAEHYARRPMMLQPFVPAITAEGEYSLCFFDGEFSHALLKAPSPGDFRVQEEHGGILTPCQPSPELREHAEAALRAAVEETGAAMPLYARVDLVRADAERFWLMELELIEPALYLRLDAAAPGNLARAIARACG